MSAPYNTKAVANLVLERAGAKGLALSPMKLQKLIYFAHGWTLTLSDQPLIDEPIEAWQYGPVVESLYHEFKDCGNAPIERLATEFDLNNFERYTPVLDNQDKVKVLPIIDKVIEVYGKYSAVQLSNMTHEPDSPWAHVWAEAKGKRNVDIPDDQIRIYFNAKRQQANKSAA